MAEPKKFADTRPLWPWVILLLIFVFMAAVRIRLADASLERDEGEYAYAGQLILKGIPPYKLAYNMKLPGTYLAYAAILAAFGQSPYGIHLGMVFVNGVTLLLVFLIGRKLFDAIAGLVAAAAFALLSTSPAFLGPAAHANHFVVLFAVAGLLVLLKAQESGQKKGLFFAGLLLGLAFLMKQQGMFFILFGFVSLLWNALQTRPIKWKELGVAKASLLAGAVVPFLVTCLWLWMAGVFDKFWFWTFKYAQEYATAVSITEVPMIFWHTFFPIFNFTWAFWLLALLGINLLLILKSTRSKALWLLLFFGCSVLALSVGFYYRPHYFLLVLPALCLLAGGFISQLRALFPPKKQYQIAPVILFLGLFFHAVYLHREFFFTLSPSQLTATMYRGNPFRETEAVADYIRQNSSADARIAVLGSEPEIYFLSNRRSATGYIYTYPLMELQPLALQMQKEMIQEIESTRPEYVVLVKVDFSWLVRSRSEQLILNWAGAYTAANYGVVGLVDFVDGEAKQSWGPNVSINPKGDDFILVFRRRSN